jgi:hypothetical protein
MRNSQSLCDLTAVDQVKAHLAFHYKHGMKPERIIGEADARCSAANGVHGVQPLLSGQSFAEPVRLPAQIAGALGAKEHISGRSSSFDCGIILVFTVQQQQRLDRAALVDH